MRRTLAFLAILLFAIPAGVSLSGCGKSSPIQFCQGSSGPRIGQTYSIALEPRYYGKSLAFGQTETWATPTAADCQGNPTAIQAYKWGSSNPSIVDINPITGEICAGQWNRNTPGGVADYSTCTPGTVSGTSQIYAQGGGATSNYVTVYTHEAIANVTLGNPATTTTNPANNCTNNPSTDCCPITNDAVVTAPAYVGDSCVSQKQTYQIVARAFNAAGQNITCTIGHPTFEAVTSDLINIDENGVATAQKPGTTVVRVSISNSSSEAGYFSVCPPVSISLSSTNASGGSVNINPNTTETLTTEAKDKNNVVLTGLNLTYTSTTPNTVGVSSSGILATLPSAASITAYCKPPTCNPSPIQYLGLFGSGKPIVSKSLLANASGNSGTQMWISGTDAQSIVPVDFVLGNVGAPVRLPFQPNSMVITQDGSTIYMGSNRALMTFTTATNTVAATKDSDLTIQGRVLAVAPNNASIVVTDPARTITQLYNPSNGATVATFNGVATRAQYSPDSSTVFVAVAPNASSSADTVVAYNTVTGVKTITSANLWSGGVNDLALTVPYEGVFVAGNSGIDGRSYCENTTNVSPATLPGSAIPDDQYYPNATNGTVTVPSDRIIATNDGKHVIGTRLTTSGSAPTLNDISVTLPQGECSNNNAATGGQGTTPSFMTSILTPVPLAGVTAAVVNELVPSTTGSAVFVTYTAPAGAATTGTLLPEYAPSASGPGTVSYVTLANGATAPVAGVFTSDNKTFYVGTSGDNKIHVINPTTLTDASQFDPKLPAASGSGYATPNLIVQKPRKTT